MSTRFVLAAAMVLVLASCGGSEMWAATEDDTGSRFDVGTGDLLEIRLASNPSTGFGWAVATMPGALRASSDDYEEPDGALVGQAGTQVLVFEAVDSGAGILRLEYLRPFDDPPVPERVVEYVVVVDDAEWPPSATQPPVTSSATAPIGVSDLADLAPGPVIVEGFVVWDQSSARLCELLMESYPAQCGGTAVEIADPDELVVVFDEAGGVRWTAGPVILSGTWDGERFAIDG